MTATEFEGIWSGSTGHTRVAATRLHTHRTALVRQFPVGLTSRVPMPMPAMRRAYTRMSRIRGSNFKSGTA
jgi:hypothetical protein